MQTSSHSTNVAPALIPKAIQAAPALKSRCQKQNATAASPPHTQTSSQTKTVAVGQLLCGARLQHFPQPVGRDARRRDGAGRAATQRGRNTGNSVHQTRRIERVMRFKNSRFGFGDWHTAVVIHEPEWVNLLLSCKTLALSSAEGLEARRSDRVDQAATQRGRNTEDSVD